jgi:hypothetical protein
MSKRIEIAGKFYRLRGGKWVQIPDKWVGKTIHRQTINKRSSKLTGKYKRRQKGHLFNHKYGWYGSGFPCGKDYYDSLDEDRSGRIEDE